MLTLRLNHSRLRLLNTTKGYNSVMKSQLLNSEELASMIYRTRKVLFNGADTPENRLRITATLDAIALDIHYCVEDWADVMRVYRWAYCTFRRILKLPEKYSDIDNLITDLQHLETAYNAANRTYIRYLRGESLESEMTELGFAA